jgi:hypothetical protein
MKNAEEGQDCREDEEDNEGEDEVPTRHTLLTMPRLIRGYTRWERGMKKAE